ncbi:hypothetical protein [Microvirga sp. VF16]|uniref:hypothetical protein n=1 Tax=Microvirga sp. VF16 TaxID=2807101 RepID=UPI00193E45BB|nr:hypothetical protein [Microvirga sp. VF16]QRM32872.1 hypothetical protein JO965_26350 [Microvirga sp. VF16]
MNLQEVEAVARALYEIQVEGWGWHREPERLKEKFREEARAAIAVLDKHDKHSRTSKSVQSLSSHGAKPDWAAFFVTADKRRKH